MIVSFNLLLIVEFHFSDQSPLQNVVLSSVSFGSSLLPPGWGGGGVYVSQISFNYWALFLRANGDLVPIICFLSRRSG